MQPVHQVQQTLDELFNPIIGDIKVKTYFSYYGIFSVGIMFALYKNEHIYLRASKETEAELKAVEEALVPEEHRSDLGTKNFYALPLSYVRTSNQFANWVKIAIRNLQQIKFEEEEKLKTQIRSMINLNIKIERILKRINIHNVNDLKQKGYMDTFVELIKQGADGSDLLLYKLHGALIEKSIYRFTDEEKIVLLKEANQALYNAGLRQRFNIPED